MHSFLLILLFSPLTLCYFLGDHDCNREAALSWNGEGSFLFTSSSAPYDCNDNGQCIEVTNLFLSNMNNLLLVTKLKI